MKTNFKSHEASISNELLSEVAPQNVSYSELVLNSIEVKFTGHCTWKVAANWEVIENDGEVEEFKTSFISHDEGYIDCLTDVLSNRDRDSYEFNNPWNDYEGCSDEWFVTGALEKLVKF